MRFNFRTRHNVHHSRLWIAHPTSRLLSCDSSDQSEKQRPPSLRDRRGGLFGNAVRNPEGCARGSVWDITDFMTDMPDSFHARHLRSVPQPAREGRSKAGNSTPDVYCPEWFVYVLPVWPGGAFADGQWCCGASSAGSAMCILPGHSGRHALLCRRRLGDKLARNLRSMHNRDCLASILTREAGVLRQLPQACEC